MSVNRLLLIGCVLIMGLGWIGYSNTLSAPFVYDDASVLTARTPKIYDNMRLLDALDGPRTLTYYTYGVNHRLGALEPDGYHLFNIGVHLLSSLALVWLLWRLLAVTGNKHHAAVAALFAGALFAVHPIQTEGVTYLSGRAGLLAALFYIVTLASYCSWRQTKKWWWLPITLVTGWLAVHAKETALTLPLSLGLFEALFFARSWWQGKRRVLVLVLLTLIIVGASLFLLRGRNLPTQVNEAYNDKVVTREQFIFTQQVVKTRYLQLIGLPYGQSVDHEVRVVSSVRDPRLIASTLLLIALIGAAIALALRRQPIIASGILFWFIALLPESSVYPLPEQMVEYRMYLPMAGVVLGVGGILYWLLQRFKPQLVLGPALVIILMLTGATYQRNELWRDPVALWANAAERVQFKARPHLNQGLELLRQERLDEAETAFLKAQEVDASYKLVHHNLGVLYRHQGRLSKAIAYFEQALDVWPENALAHYSLGTIYVVQGKHELALHSIEQAVVHGLESAEPLLEQLRQQQP